MGVELVEASDLVVRDDVLYMRTTAGLERVHAVYRRLDDDFVDPLEFRPDSLLGVPGLVRAYRAGTVAIANAFGTGVADDKAIYHYVPDMIRFYLDEEPILDNVTTYLLADDDAARGRARRACTSSSSSRRASRGGKGVFIGPLDAARRARGLADVDPRAARSSWIAQEVVKLSTVPTAGADGALSPRHVDLRPFAVFGEDIRIVPGGLTRVALVEGSMIVNSSRGGGSKDTWVLEDGEPTPTTAPSRRRRDPAAAARCPTCTTAAPGSASSSSSSSSSSMLARIAHELFWLGRNVARAEHTARHARRRLPGRPPGPPRRPGGRRARPGARCWRSWARRGEATARRRDEVLRSLTLDPDNPASVVACVAPRARGRAHACATSISAEMWEAINTTKLDAARQRRSRRRACARGPYSRLRVRQASAARCSGA